MTDATSLRRFVGRHAPVLDRLAIGLSGLCVIHCVASVLLLTLLASAGSALLHPLIHEVGLGLAIAIGAVALGYGYFTHRRMLPCLIGSVGLVIMAVALTMEHGAYEAVLTVIGVSFVALGHLLNRRAITRTS